MTSERVNSLSERAELFYRRLMSVVDDYGRFSANPTLLRASCYPLHLDSVKEDSIKKHLAEAASAGLIVLYTVAGKAYLEMQDFNQQVRAKQSKYPAPDGQMQSTCLADATHMQTSVHLGVVGDVVEDEDVEEAQQPKRSRGSRLPPDWILPDDYLQTALQIRKDWSAEDVHVVGDKFRDYWHSAAGSKGVKADWLATWRNWVREERHKGGATAGKATPPPWWSSEALMTAKGHELGLQPRPGEDWSQFRGRINERLAQH